MRYLNKMYFKLGGIYEMNREEIAVEIANDLMEKDGRFVKLIILFGSVAKGLEREKLNSDIDLFIILENNPIKQFYDFWDYIYEKIHLSPIKIDAYVFTEYGMTHLDYLTEDIEWLETREMSLRIIKYAKVFDNNLNEFTGIACKNLVIKKIAQDVEQFLAGRKAA